MSTYSLNVYSLDSASTSLADILTSEVTGNQWEWNQWSNPTLTVVPGATATTVTISDTDSSPTTFEDDSENQLSTEDVTIGDVTYPAGTMFSDEYEITLADSLGNAFRLVAVAVREYIDPWTYNDVIIGFTWEGPEPEPGTLLTYTPGSALDSTSMVPCFTPGTLIDTPAGRRPVEALRAGDRVISPDGTVHRLIWTRRRRIDAPRLAKHPALRPVRIRKGALGVGLPDADLLVSQQHRMLVRSPVAQRITGAREVLVAAKHLVGLPGIDLAEDQAAVSYVHLLCGKHVILTANGAATESLYPGAQALRALSHTARTAIVALLPDLADGAAPTPARPFASARAARRLAARHIKNNRPVLMPA